MEPRYVGIRQRVKKTAEGDAHPTQVVIIGEGKSIRHSLADETDELDFLLGRFPIEYRDLAEGEDASTFRPHQVRKTQRSGGGGERIRVPYRYDGLRAGDKVAMILGGSGGNFMYALSRRAEEIGAEIFAVAPVVLKDRRGSAEKDDDQLLLASLLQAEPDVFYRIGPRDRKQILISALYRERQDAQKARIACEQRLYQRLNGRTFLRDDGYYPEGQIEDLFDAMKANDAILQGHIKEEKQREAELRKAVRDYDVWWVLFEPIEGCGEVLAAGIMSAIIDIRRFKMEPDAGKIADLRALADALKVRANFEQDIDKVAERLIEATETTKATSHFQIVQMVRSWKRANSKEEEAVLLDEAIECYRKSHKLKSDARRKSIAKVNAYCGTHVLPDGRFPRNRSGRGEKGNWHRVARQSLYNLADQFNRRKMSRWGMVLLGRKATIRAKHPEPIKDADGKTRYTDGHVHRQAIWSTLTRVTKDIARQWFRMEERRARDEK